jgi:hypothetical protein
MGAFKDDFPKLIRQIAIVMISLKPDYVLPNRKLLDAI